MPSDQAPIPREFTESKKIDLEVPMSMLVAFPKRFVVYLCLKCGFDDFHMHDGSISKSAYNIPTDI